ncbi:MAG: type I DNA topoisomerase [Prevotellaceae bacterium]|jgi:DNA topoisomerase-1|nr:type I DNA topoisomerase [Prevotellaceae bacterium]
MGSQLLIVESPAKAKTIEKYLGKEFKVKSSYGHIRDLVKKNLGIDMRDGLVPEYEIPTEKEAVVKELKTLASKATTVWLASDEDREGEAISWHLQESLGLDPKNTKRIVFHEITKDAILHAIENPRSVDMNLVNAQQARRVLDRLVGFEISPILWKKLKPKLSAGRVQSVAVRLIVEREREVLSHSSQAQFKAEAIFSIPGSKTALLKAEADVRFDTEQEAFDFLTKCIGAVYTVGSVEKKAGTRSPAPPFTTSTLQQEASRKLGFSVSQTMNVAQKLYESGLITYMRTDSTQLSKMALSAAHKCVETLYGADYCKTRQYTTKSKSAQEAHEAIRPAYLQNAEIEGSAQEKRLYNLIWKRTIASQMADAQIEKTTITINVSTSPHPFIATGEVVLFDGFIKVYHESRDDENDNTKDDDKTRLPQLHTGDTLTPQLLSATQRFSPRPPRYTEASLVKKLEELGIGRPSTYAPTISTIVQRGYVTKEDRTGTPRTYIRFEVVGTQIVRKELSETVGAEKAKLFPSDIGMLVNDFLVDHFTDIVDYGFTAKAEEDLDRIADGSLGWQRMLADFYHPFHKVVQKTLEQSRPTNAERALGVDPKTGKEVTVRIGRFGPVAQIGSNDDEKKQFASLQKGQLIESITLDEALQLFQLPRNLGNHQDKEVICSTGRFGPYIKYNSKFISLGKKDDPYTVTIDRAIEIINEALEKEREKLIKHFETEGIQILNGRFGPYISHNKNNYKIPKGQDPAAITLEACLAIITEGPVKPKKRPASKK